MRATTIGSKLPFRGALLFLQAEWMEIVTSVGFPSWSHHDHPCPLCSCPKDSLPNTASLSVAGLLFPENTFEVYCRVCDLCEQIVVVDAEHHRLLRLLLIYDRSKGGLKARILSKDCPPLGLFAHDRLAPSASLPNIHGGFDDLDAFPVTVTFWCGSLDTVSRHRNPMFSDIEKPEDVLAMDSLHALSLSVSTELYSRTSSTGSRLSTTPLESLHTPARVCSRTVFVVGIIPLVQASTPGRLLGN